MNNKSVSSHVLIVEPHATGHHGIYLQWMVASLIEKGFKVTLMTLRESLDHSSLKQFATTFSGVVDIIDLDSSNYLSIDYKGPFKLIRREWDYWRMFRDWYKEHTTKPNIVLLPYLDYCLYAISLLGSPFGKTSWMGIAMRPSFHYHKMGIIAPRSTIDKFKRFLFFRLLENKYLKLLLSIDEPLIEYLKNQELQSKNVRYLPEPSENEVVQNFQEVRRKLGVNSNQKIILVYGSLDSRKGINELLLALNSKNCPENVDVLLAGKISDDIQELLSKDWVQTLQREHRLVILNRFMLHEDDRLLFSAADFVWLGYHRHYTASCVMVQAGRAGLPVIACEEGVLGWQVKRYELGVAVRTQDIDSVVTGIRILTEDEEMCKTCGLNGQRAFKENNYYRAGEILTSACLNINET